MDIDNVLTPTLPTPWVKPCNRLNHEGYGTAHVDPRPTLSQFTEYFKELRNYISRALRRTQSIDQAFRYYRTYVRETPGGRHACINAAWHGTAHADPRPSLHHFAGYFKSIRELWL